MSGINTVKLQELVINYYKQYIPDLAKRFEDILKEEFEGLAGEIPFDWTAKGVDDIIKIDPVFEGGQLYCKVGWNYDTEWENARIMVGLHGNHERQLFIAVKPGEPTWQDSLMDPREYHSEKDILGPMRIPQFDRHGIDAVENAIKRFEPIYNDAIKQIEDSMPIADFIEQCMA